MKLARNIANDNKEHERMAPGPGQEEVIPEKYEKPSHALTRPQTSMYVLSTHYLF